MTALNKYRNCLIKMFRAKSKDLGDKMKMILDHFDEQTTDIVSHRYSTALRGLPLYLRERDAISKTCVDTDLEETYTRGVKLGILEVMEDNLSQATKRCQNLAIILEETVVVEDVPDFPTAFMRSRVFIQLHNAQQKGSDCIRRFVAPVRKIHHKC